MERRTDSLPILSADEVESFHENGFLVPRFRFEGDELRKLQDLTQRLVANNPQVTNGHIGSPHLLNGKGTQQVKTERGWLEIAAHPKLVQLVGELIGPDLALWTSTLFCKPPLEGPATPWHRDGAFYPITPIETTTSWIAVFESVRENGCLRILPGSHKARDVGAHRRERWSKKSEEEAGSLALSEADEARAVDVPLEPGQMVLFDIFTAHASWPNQGTKPRAGYAVRFLPTTSRYDHDAGDEDYKVAGGVRNRQLILVSGRDRAGNRFGDIDEVMAGAVTH
jgi:Phytanoyl-CoA dioxygenase (PhyH)